MAAEPHVHAWHEVVLRSVIWHWCITCDAVGWRNPSTGLVVPYVCDVPGCGRGAVSIRGRRRCAHHKGADHG